MLKAIAPVCVALGVIFVVSRAAASTLGDESGLPSKPAACAEVTWLAGAPMLIGPDSAQQPLALGQRLYPGNVLQTDGTSRLELIFPDGDLVRMAEESTIELGAEALSTGEGDTLYQVALISGNIWVSLSKRIRADGFRMLATVAVFSGTESVFRAAMFPGGAVEAKTYTGKVTAEGPFEMVKENGRYALRTFSNEEDETVEPWRHQMEPYWKMIVLPSGEASPPFRFSAKSDLTEWVRWNQQREEGR